MTLPFCPSPAPLRERRGEGDLDAQKKAPFSRSGGEQRRRGIANVQEIVTGKIISLLDWVGKKIEAR